MPSIEGLFELSRRASGKAGCALARAECASTACSPIGSRHLRKLPRLAPAPVFKHIR